MSSRSRSQSFRSSEGEPAEYPSQDSHELQHRRFSTESARSYRKLSQQDNTSRKTPGQRRISGASFFANFKKPDMKEQPLQDIKVRFENTYRMEPKAHFPEGKVRSVIKEALDTLVSHNYNPTHSPFVAKLLSSRILENVKQLNVGRYKVVCLVTIGSKKSQDLRVASRCLWDSQFDTFVSVCFESEQFFCCWHCLRCLLRVTDDSFVSRVPPSGFGDNNRLSVP